MATQLADRGLRDPLTHGAVDAAEPVEAREGRDSNHALESGEQQLAREEQEKEEQLAREAQEKAPASRDICMVLCGSYFLGTVVALYFAVFMHSCPTDFERVLSPVQMSNATTPPPADFSPGVLALAANLESNRKNQHLAFQFVFVAFLSVVGSAFTSSLHVIFDPLDTKDFYKKGTLSNVSQDASTPRGRLFSVFLFTACILMIFSNYPFEIYRTWIPRVDLTETVIPSKSVETPIFMFEDWAERWWRTAWLIAPQVGFMFTAAIPSPSALYTNNSENAGWKTMFALVHNIAAPLSMAFMIFMETYQLSYGEMVYSSFGCDPPKSWVTPTTNCQRFRGILVIYAWIAVVFFLGVQVYYGLGDYLPNKPCVQSCVKPSYKVALVSFFCEVTGMILVYALPVIAGFEILYWNHSKGSIMHETREVVSNFHWGPWPPWTSSTPAPFEILT